MTWSDGPVTVHVGDARRRRRITGPAEVRFWAKVAPVVGGCWLWSGALSSGHGNFWDGVRFVQAHRYAYEALIAEVPDGLVLDHLCRVRRCVNPTHLEPVTNAVNVLRGVGFAALNAAKEECVNGHPFDLLNTYVDSLGKRHCRACRADAARRLRARRAG